jgi:hypothetical protein
MQLLKIAVYSSEIVFLLYISIKRYITCIISYVYLQDDLLFLYCI